ncbi:MAG: DUF349 domain-containing protein [Tannerella sp.]|nr:DUF349 domain-containing protein [Tannerella sp.]
MLRAEESGETRPVILPEEIQTSEDIRPDELTNEVVEETSIQQTVIEQPDVAPKVEDVVPEKADAWPGTAEVSPDVADVVPESEDALPPEDEDVLPEKPEASAFDNEKATADNPEPETPDSGERAADEPELKELPTTPDNFCGELQEAIEEGAIGMLNKQEILDELKERVAYAETSTREQVDELKQAYYRVDKMETDELRRVFVENGGNEADFRTPEDETASLLKDLLSEYKRKKTLLHEQEEHLKEENYAKKLQLIDRLQALVESQDDFHKQYNEFKEIQYKWKKLDPVPQGQARELWRNYQAQSERFYDLIKINNQFRDYDFKKNLELKTALCEAAEKLANEPDTISAYHQSQKLFQQWRELGPVARDLRESLWARFKDASAVINRNHHAHFEMLKAHEEKNLSEKTAICETIESIDCESLKTFRDWEKKTREVVELQKRWRTLGYTARKQSSKVFERFRKACDRYFESKSAFYKTVKKDFEKNFQLKQELVVKVEELKHRTDWKEATKAIIDLQNEWKKIGPVARKHSDILWKQFIGACDYFFEQKNKLFYSHKTEESTNLATKQLLIKKINELDRELPAEEVESKLKLLIAEWNTVGHVPFKEKDSIYKAFRTAVDKQYERLDIAHSDRRQQQYTTAFAENGHDKGKMHNERDRLMRTYERMKSELQTYENNVGFFNVSSKGGNTLRKEMDRKIEQLKEEIALIVKKIDAIDENLE